jgi:hypothetical protein
MFASRSSVMSNSKSRSLFDTDKKSKLLKATREIGVILATKPRLSRFTNGASFGEGLLLDTGGFR